MSEQKNKSLIQVSSYNLTSKQKLDIETRRIILRSIIEQPIMASKSKMEWDDEKYTELITLMLKKDSFNIVNGNNNIEEWIESFTRDDCWLEDTYNRFANNNSELESFLKNFSIQYLINFILKYKKCIIADIENVKEIMDRNNRILNDENLIDYASSIQIAAFEAPSCHINRIWLLKVAKIILDRYSKLAQDFISEEQNIDGKIFSNIHNELYKTAYVPRTKSKYNKFLKSSKDNFLHLRKFKNLILVTKRFSKEIQLSDLNEPEFDIEDFEFRHFEAEAKPKAEKKRAKKKLKKSQKAEKQRLIQEKLDTSQDKIYTKFLNSINKKSNENKTKIEKKEAHNVEIDKLSPAKKKIKIDSESNLNPKTEPETNQVDFDTEDYSVEKTDASTQTKARHLSNEKVKKIDVSIQAEPLNILQNANSMEKGQSKEFSCLCVNLNKLYTDGKHTDLVLLTRDKKIRVHKCVLAAHSDILSEMLENDAKFIDMSKEEPEAVESMLEFMYKNQVDNLDSISIHLFNIACEYNIRELIELCEKKLHQKVNIENSSDIFILAAKSKNEKLKKEVIKFIILNRKKVVKTDGFRNMQVKHPDLLAELFCYEANDF